MTFGGASAAVLMVRKRGAAPRTGRREDHNDTHHKDGGHVPPPRWQRWIGEYGWAGVRTGVLFIAGLLGVLHETLAESGERPSLLILFAAMLGLSIVSGSR